MNTLMSANSNMNTLMTAKSMRMDFSSLSHYKASHNNSVSNHNNIDKMFVNMSILKDKVTSQDTGRKIGSML